MARKTNAQRQQEYVARQRAIGRTSRINRFVTEQERRVILAVLDAMRTTDNETIRIGGFAVDGTRRALDG